ITGGADVGVDATATVTVDGSASNITATGRSFDLDAGGVQGTVNLITDTTALAEGAAPGAVTFTVYPGGKPLLDHSGSVISRQAFSVFDAGTLGVSEGGLDQIDLVNDAA